MPKLNDRYQYNSQDECRKSGGFGTVYPAIDTKLERKVALKFYDKATKEKYSVKAEIKRVIHLDHDNICKYYDYEELHFVNEHGDSDKKQIGVMEYIDGGTITDYLNKYGRSNVESFIEQLLLGITYLHEQKPEIWHRDIKPDNILTKMDSKAPGGAIVKIIDFGISKQVEGEKANKSTDTIGTPMYMAPELLAMNGNLTSKMDVWSFGAVVYELLTGKSLINGSSTTDIVIHNVLNEDFSKKINEIPSEYEKFKSLFTKALSRKVESRPTAAELYKEFFISGDTVTKGGATLPIANDGNKEPIAKPAVSPDRSIKRRFKKDPIYFLLVIIIALSVFGLSGAILYNSFFRELTSEEWFQKGEEFRINEEYVKAQEMYENAIRLDYHGRSAYELGHFYMDGYVGGAPDYDKARLSFQIAVQHLTDSAYIKVAAFELGCIYRYGLGSTKQDLNESDKWFSFCDFNDPIVQSNFYQMEKQHKTPMNSQTFSMHKRLNLWGRPDVGNRYDIEVTDSTEVPDTTMAPE